MVECMAHAGAVTAVAHGMREAHETAVVTTPVWSGALGGNAAPPTTLPGARIGTVVGAAFGMGTGAVRVVVVGTVIGVLGVMTVVLVVSVGIAVTMSGGAGRGVMSGMVGSGGGGGSGRMSLPRAVTPPAAMTGPEATEVDARRHEGVVADPPWKGAVGSATGIATAKSAQPSYRGCPSPTM